MAQLYLKKAIAASGDASVFQLKRLLEMLDKLSNERNEEFADTNAPPELVNAIMNIIRTGAPSGGDIIKICRVYKSPSPPPVSILREPDVIEPIIRMAFGASHPTNLQAEKIWLLAYAAFWNSSNTVKEDIRAGTALLTDLSQVIERSTSMIQLQSQLSHVLSMLKEPICCAILLVWLAASLFNDDFYEWTALSMSIPCAFHILDEVRPAGLCQIAVLHPFHRERIFDIWISLFEREFTFRDMEARVVQQVIIQYREKFVDHFVLLFNYHFEKPVLSYLASKADSIDPSLQIHFLSKVAGER
ncbi:Negative elongation factor C/D [Kappamyces sp. JEL0829]|nr:Negative elongation factor C/D [Kappamyces sp. JEL0829]